MHLRSILPLLLCLLCPLVRGQEADADLRRADESLASGLWEVAAFHYGQILQSTNLAPGQNARAAIGLAESWVRAGKSAEALDLLEQSFVRNHPEQPFWKAQALASSGRISEAIALLAPLLEITEAPHRYETAVSLANLQLSLKQTDSALRTLSEFRKSADPAKFPEILLREVEILIDAQQHTEARKLFSSIDKFPSDLQTRGDLLNAHLMLAENRPTVAAGVFKSLLDQSRNLNLRQFHSAAVGLVDALMNSEDSPAAFAFLVSFLAEHPDSPELEAFFLRIEKMLPQKPTAGDPLLEQLGQWITACEFPPTGLVLTDKDGCSNAWPSAKVHDEIIAYALFTRALALDRNESAAALVESQQLLNRLRAQFPSHPLVNRALLMFGKRKLLSGSAEQAFYLLTLVRENSKLPSQRGEAAFLQAQEAYKNGEMTPAAKLFEEAANELTSTRANNARFNSLVALALNDKQASPSLTTITNINDAALADDIALERAMAAKASAEKTQAIESFLNQHPDHPRANEARLAAAHSALDQPIPDTSLARTQLEFLSSPTNTPQAASPSQIAWLKLRISSSARDLPETIANATALLSEFPGDPMAEDAAMLLGRAYFESRSYNDARLTLEKLAATSANPSRAQAAWLLAARSAALVQTPQSRQEAIILFQKAAESNSPLSSVAKLEMARLMIDMNQAQDAIKLLQPWFDSIAKNDPIEYPCGLLLGDALQSLGLTRPEELAKALEIYNRLLSNSPKNSASFNHLQYLRGRTLEQLPDKSGSPGLNEEQALLAYCSVLETTDLPAEWNYFELCGFRALAFLEKSQRWPAAIACARKIASFKGPRADEAKQRAEQIRLKNMIWED